MDIPTLFMWALATLFGPPKPTPAIEMLIDSLGSVTLSVRETAEMALRGKTYSALTALRAAANHHPDLEVRYRTRRILDDYYRVAPSGWSALPSIDAVPFPFVRDWYYRKALELHPPPGGFMDHWDWVDYEKMIQTQATVVFLHDLLDWGVQQNQVQHLLDQMLSTDHPRH